MLKIDFSILGNPKHDVEYSADISCSKYVGNRV